MKVSSLIKLFVLLLLISCSKKSTDNTEQLIIDKLENFVDSHNNKDIEGTMAIMSRDLVENFPPNADISYDDFKKQYNTSYSNTKTNPKLEIEIEEIIADKTIAMNRNRWKYFITDAKTDSLVYYGETRSMEIWKKEPDGEWRIIRSLATIITEEN